MEEKNIVYTGITQATSDLDCPDGDLSISHNIINQNGAMRPIVMPDAEFTMGSGEILLHIHSGSGYKNYIYIKDRSLKAFHIMDGTRIDIAFSYNLENGEEISQIQTFGNTLVILSNLGVKYVLYKNSVYVYLGDKIPELEFSFALAGGKNVVFIEKKDVSIDKNTTPENIMIYSYINKDGSAQLTDALMGGILEFIERKKGDGCFMEPFFVRYAYKTINGYMKQSPPVLMIPNGGAFPYIFADSFEYSNSGESGVTIKKVKGVNAAMNCGSLLFKIWNTEFIEKIKDWGDIVSSIDVFVSSPISRLKSDGIEWLAFRGEGEDDLFNSYRFLSYGGYMGIGNDSFENPIYGYSGDFSNLSKPALCAPQLSYSEFQEKISTVSLFYKVKSIPVDKIADHITNNDGFSDLKIDNVLGGNVLETQEKLPDDYMSGDSVIANKSFVYNARLHISGITRKPSVFGAYQYSCYTNGSLQPDGSTEKNTNQYRVTIFIRDGGGIVRTITSSSEDLRIMLPYVYYPNPNAYSAIIEKIDSRGGVTYAELTLKEHSLLNGAYYVSEAKISNPYPEMIDIVFTSKRPSLLDVDAGELIQESGKVYVSEVNNPFLFPVEGRITVGTGTVLGISSTTRALSQGQFGQFPLLVFSTDGIWAIEVSSTGLYSVKQPVSRDVCNNPDSITQIDGAVVFTSDKGVMIVDGSDVRLISAELDGMSFDVESVNDLDIVLNREGLEGELGNIVSTKDYFKECRIGYDYPNARLFFYAKEKPYAYVYSLNARTWGTVSSYFQNIVLDYPNTYIQQVENEVINLSEKTNFDSDKEVKVLLLSRPMKLGDDGYKTINTIINRGVIRKNEGAIVVFASFDGLEYSPIGSAIGNRLSRLQGSPYRYFRMSTVGKMTVKEALSLTSVYYTPKWRNKPR